MNKKPTGLFAAWIVASIAGMFFYVVTNIGAEISAPFKSFFQIHKGVGPYSGKTFYGFITTLVVGGILQTIWKNRDINIKTWSYMYGVFLVGAILLVFPPVYEVIVHAFK